MGTKGSRVEGEWGTTWLSYLVLHKCMCDKENKRFCTCTCALLLSCCWSPSVVTVTLTLIPRWQWLPMEQTK